MAGKIGIETEIELFAALERREVLTQPVLARRLSISVGKVNALLKRANRRRRSTGCGARLRSGRC